MTHDPYAAPAAPLHETPVDPIAVYTPSQVGAATFLGGPLALVYFLRSNFLALGDPAAATKTIWAGIALFVGVIAAGAMLPEKFPGTPLTIALVVSGYYYTERAQLTKAAIDASPHYRPHSNWRVFGLAMACLAVTFALIIAIVAGLMALGVDL